VNRALLAVAIVAACSDKQASTPSSPPTAPVLQQPAPARVQQLVTAIPDNWTSTTATLQLWTRTAASPWQRVGDSWTAVLGRTGSAWGTGMHADPKRPGPRKHEGDGKSPAGMFAIRAAYGYAPAATTRLPYRPSDRLECVDDVRSPHYAQIVDPAGVTRDWTSAEQMRRSDELYTWVVELAHNPTRVRGDGSCIFLHVWSDATSTTSGCTAMPEATLAELVRTLDPSADPRYVLLPRAEYQALAVEWDLPPP
jgi:L,D-peptidoglycan transpeptidase YkuD (ErfK/YbiS/YcfS/YnhG family)